MGEGEVWLVILFFDEHIDQKGASRLSRAAGYGVVSASKWN